MGIVSELFTVCDTNDFFTLSVLISMFGAWSPIMCKLNYRIKKVTDATTPGLGLGL